jgi:hypothetical protein
MDYSMFGAMLPQQAQEEDMRSRMVSPNTFAQLNPLQQIVALGGNAGAMVGGAVGNMMGGRTAKEAEGAMIKEVFDKASQMSEDPAEQYAFASKEFRRLGMNDRALALEDRVGSLSTSRAKVATEQAKAQKEQAAAAREESLRTELASLPPEATDQEVEAVVRKYGNPDQIFKTLERRQTAEANRVAKAEQERARLEAQQQQRQIAQSIQALSIQQRQATNDLQREKIQGQIDAQKQKLAETADKKQMALDMNIRHAEKVITDVAAAKELASGFGNTGIIGKASSLVPGSDAYNLNQRVLTLKANLGFDRLQQMRDASPTGGALGQVAVQELEALQASVGSLEIGQSKAELLKNMEKVEKHYKAWLNAVKGGRGGGLNPQDQQAMDWANANPNDPRSAEIKQRLGAQ